MSASEKLRALTAEAFPIPRQFSDEERAVQRQLSAALPLIADVVEAAEETQRIEQRRSASSHGFPFAHLDAALTALQEHLEGTP